MRLRIERLEKVHVDEAAKLVGRRYAALRAQVPSLPSSYEDPDAFSGRLLRLIDRGVGVAAFDGGRMLGFLVAHPIGPLRGRPCALSPEWGNGADAATRRRVVEAMYREAAPEWLRRGDVNHVVCVLAHDSEALEAWVWAGFGRMVCDAVRALEPIAASRGGPEVQRASPDDVESILPLARALREHLAAAPVYVLDRKPEDRAAWDVALRDPAIAVWIAARRGSVIGYLRQEPSTDDACDVIVDAGTTSITGAYVEPTARGEGVATSLLARAIDWGREQGYARCSVDFETANSSAARFWLQHFSPIVVSLGRTHDPRLMPA